MENSKMFGPLGTNHKQLYIFFETFSLLVKQYNIYTYYKFIIVIHHNTFIKCLKLNLQLIITSQYIVFHNTATISKELGPVFRLLKIFFIIINRHLTTP